MNVLAASLVLFAIAANASILAPRVACNADNCARAVTGTAAKPALTSRISDCSSFQRTTITPDASTITVQAASVVTSVVSTTTTTYLGTYTSYQLYTAPAEARAKRSAVGNQGPFEFPRLPPAAQTPRAVLQRAVPPPTVPSYASACSGSARYASACSCYGITSTITTLPTPLVTRTTTSTTTTTSTFSDVQPTAVVTVTVCNQQDDNGYFFQSVTFDDTASTTVDFLTLDGPGCCAACFSSENPNCISYAYLGGDQCQLSIVVQGDLSATYNCPLGRVGFFTEQQGLPVVGTGPCGKA